MHVSAAGTAAQMEVIDDETGHLVATMEWYKAAQEFSFNLFDRTTGVVKAEFEIKPDGNAYIGGEKVMTAPDRASMRLTAQWNVNLTKAWTPFDFDGGSKCAIVQDRRITTDISDGSFLVPEDGSYVIKLGIQAEMKDNHGIEMVPMVDGVAYSTNPIIMWASDTWHTDVKAISSMYWESQMTLTAGQKVTFAVKSYYNNTHNVHFQRIAWSITQD